MEPFILKYERMIVSAEAYKKPGLDVPQQIISPSIDPLSPKNMDLPEETAALYLDEHRIPTDKPLITQRSHGLTPGRTRKGC